jgi:hypothetical protein
MHRPFQIDKDYSNHEITIAKQAVSQYQLTKSLQENLKPSLPSVEELERELAELGGSDV